MQSQKHSVCNIRSQIFPHLQVGLKRLLQQLNKNLAVSKHQEYLVKKRLFDKCEKKYIEKQLLKKELGDQYQSSDSEDQIDYNLLGQPSKTTMLKYVREQLISNSFDPQMLPEVSDDDEDTPRVVEEDPDEGEDSNDDNVAKEVQSFNPLLFLAKEIERAHKNKKLTN